MKSKITLLLLSFVFAFSVNGQDLLEHIPTDASLVLKLNGPNLFKKMDLESIRSLPSMKEFAKELSYRNIDDLNEIGVDWNSQMYFFVHSNDTMNYYSMMFKINDKEKFKTTMDKGWKDLYQDGNFYRLVGYNDLIEWNDEYALVISGSRKFDHYNWYYDDTPQVDIDENLFGTFIPSESDRNMEVSYEYEVEYAIEEVIDAPEEPVEGDFEEMEEYEPAEAIDEVIEMDAIEEIERIEAEGYVEEPYIPTRDQDDYTRLIEARNLRSLAKANSIKNNPEILGDFDANADASFIGDMSKFSEMMPSMMGGGMRGLTSGMAMNPVLYNNKIKSNLYFEEDQVLMQTDVEYDESLAESYRKIFDAEINKDFFKYIPAKHPIGYYTAAMNTQAFLEEMPKTMGTELGTYIGGEFDYTTILELYSLLLDEEAIGELINGDMMFVVNSIRPIQVEYRVYDYDDNFERTERMETKEEHLPEFLFMASTKNPDMAQKLMDFLLINPDFVKSEAGYMEMKASEYDPMQLFFAVKDGIFFICNSREQVNYITKGGGKSKLNKLHIADVQKNAGVMFLDGEKLFESLQLQYLSREEILQMEFAAKNVKQMRTYQSKMKDNVAHGTTIIEVPKGYNNSFEYLIKLIDQIYSIGEGIN